MDITFACEKHCHFAWAERGPQSLPHLRLALIGDEFSSQELNASVLVRLNVADQESCEQQCLNRDACVALEFYLAGQHTQTGTNCKLIEDGGDEKSQEQVGSCHKNLSG